MRNNMDSSEQEGKNIIYWYIYLNVVKNQLSRFPFEPNLDTNKSNSDCKKKRVLEEVDRNQIAEMKKAKLSNNESVVDEKLKKNNEKGKF